MRFNLFENPINATLDTMLVITDPLIYATTSPPF